MFNKEKVQNFIKEYLNAAIQRYNITDPRNIDSRKYLEIKSHLWTDMEMANLVPYHTGNPDKRKPGTEKIYMAVEQMIDRAFRNLGSQQTYGESVKKLGKTIMNLHECSKKGMTKKGYAMFKEAMSSLMTLEGNGCKSEVLTPAKEILAEYYNTYKTQIKKDTTRVIVEGKVDDAAKKAEDKRQNEIKSQLKTFFKEIVSNSSGMKGAISSSNYELINFHADQLSKIASKIKAITNEEINDYLE